MFNKLCLMITLVLVSGASLADKCEDWGCVSTIQDLYVNAEGGIYISTPLDETQANCTPVSGVYFTINLNKGNAKEMYSMALSAYMANSKIKLRIKENSNNCEVDYAVMSKNY